MRLSSAALAINPRLAALVDAALDRDRAQRRSGPRRRPPYWHSEADLHRAICNMIQIEAAPGVIAMHIPNGGKRGKAEAGRLRSMGTQAGAPDLLVIVAGRAHGLEIKTEAGRLSVVQKRMAERFRHAGCAYEVARSVEGARRHLATWGALDQPIATLECAT